MPRIALIHAVSVAMAPVHDAFRQLWPEAECVDILDTSLSRDRERDGRLTEAMVGRFLFLAKYAEDTSADHEDVALGQILASHVSQSGLFKNRVRWSGGPRGHAPPCRSGCWQRICR